MRWITLCLLIGCGRPLPETTGDACELAANSACDRAISCGVTASNARAACVSGVVAACCADKGKCNGSSADPGAAVRCADALSAQGCGQLGNNLRPSECVGIPNMWQ